VFGELAEDIAIDDGSGLIGAHRQRSGSDCALGLCQCGASKRNTSCYA
jgi:hypothetical protein